MSSNPLKIWSSKILEEEEESNDSDVVYLGTNLERKSPSFIDVLLYPKLQPIEKLKSLVEYSSWVLLIPLPEKMEREELIKWIQKYELDILKII